MFMEIQSLNFNNTILRLHTRNVIIVSINTMSRVEDRPKRPRRPYIANKVVPH